MHFSGLIFRNLWRRRTRSLLTMVGIAGGVAGVLALASMAWGFESTWARMYMARGTDLVIMKATSDSPVPAMFGDDRRAALADIPAIREMSGTLTDLSSVESTPAMLVFGWQPRTFIWDHLKLVTGRWAVKDDEPVAMLGVLAADILGKHVGDTLQVEAATLTVSGIYESSAFAENGAVLLTLPVLQRASENAGRINLLNLRLTPGLAAAEVDGVRRAIRARLPGFNAFAASEVASNSLGVQAGKALSWATSLLALVLGSVAVMNTMLMSVFERLHEIGVLLALGWRRSRIVRLVLFESLMQSAIGGACGIGIGVAAVKLLELAPAIRGKIEGDLSPTLFMVAFGIALALGVLGGAYPAVRASRLVPTDALRHE